jgi:predicted MFS family arabinose efflux permease
MAAAPAAGAFLGALFSGWIQGVRRTGRAIIASVAAWGLAITAFGLVTVSFPLALFFLALAGAADVFSAVFRSTLVQLETPDRLRGRVMSIHTLVVTSGPRLGDIEAAVVASLVGPQFAVVSGGVLCVVGAGVVARRFRSSASTRSGATGASPRSPADGCGSSWHRFGMGAR